MTNLKHATYDVENRKTIRLNAGIYEADDQMLTAVQEYLGCSRSEAVRSAIRIMASHLLPGRKA